MKRIVNKCLPLKGYMCMMICGLLFVRKEYENSITTRTVRHEQVHFEQQKELLFVFFFLWYVVEWLIRLCLYGNTKMAYWNISFEKEAVMAEDNENYIKNRRTFNFIRYL